MFNILKICPLFIMLVSQGQTYRKPQHFIGDLLISQVL